MRMRIWLALAMLLLAALVVMSPGCAKKQPPPPVTQQPPPAQPQRPDTTVTRPPVQEQEPEFEAQDIRFDYDKANIRDDARTTLTALGKYLMETPSARVLIEGHADERGTTEYNLALGERRAKAARDWLVAYGVGSDRISTVSYGKERPLDPGHDESAWSRNRRAHFVLQGA